MALEAPRDEQKDFSKDDLLRLLPYLEGEVQARDVVIAALKSERAKQLLYQARYGRLAADDPLCALQRDGALIGTEECDDAVVARMYETQLAQLERLISVQRRCHIRSKQILAATERRHTRTLRELDEQKQRSAADAAQGDDLCALLENERSRLRQQLEYEQKENDKVRKEVEKLEKKLLGEKERHKSMVLFLINERKQMLLKMHELRVHSEHVAGGSQEGPLLNEMRKELNTVRGERDRLRAALSSTRNEVHSLKEVIRSQEEDLALMRNSILSNTRSHSNSVRLLGDGSLVVANKGVSTPLSAPKGATATLPPPVADARHAARSRLSSSSSFPSGERGGGNSRVPLPSSSLPRPATSPISAVPSSPTKRHAGVPPSSDSRMPSSSNARNMGATNVVVERGRVPTGQMRVDRDRGNSYATEPEIEQLGAVIDSMSSKPTKRSASLPRNGAPAVGSGAETVRSTPSKSSGGTAKRNALFKAFGVSSRSDRNGSS